MRHIVLDSYPAGLISSPVNTADVITMTQWMTNCLVAGHKIYLLEVIDYELRRELLRANKTKSIVKLDGLKTILRFLPITSDAMLLAAKLWATSRQAGLPTGDPKKLDIDVILAAQALALDVLTADIIVATSNVNHISRFDAADLWGNILP